VGEGAEPTRNRAQKQTRVATFGFGEDGGASIRGAIPRKEILGGLREMLQARDIGLCAATGFRIAEEEELEADFGYRYEGLRTEDYTAAGFMIRNDLHARAVVCAELCREREFWIRMPAAQPGGLPGVVVCSLYGKHQGYPMAERKAVLEQVFGAGGSIERTRRMFPGWPVVALGDLNVSDDDAAAKATRVGEEPGTKGLGEWLEERCASLGLALHNPPQSTHRRGAVLELWIGPREWCPGCAVATEVFAISDHAMVHGVVFWTKPGGHRLYRRTRSPGSGIRTVGRK
jgi:hypothetical protein